MPCLFCGGTPLTKEHAIPLWIGDVLPGSGAWIHRHTITHGGKPLREWRKPLPDLKAKVACAKCNNGWLSQLEGQAKPILTPMLLGKSQRLELHHLELVTYWSLKTALTLDRCSEAAMQNIPSQEYAELYRLRTVLPSTHVWLGACTAARGSWFQARTVEMDTRDARVPGWGATLWAGHLVFQIIRIPVPASLKIGVKEDVIGDLAPIWPRGFKLDWPASRRLELNEVVDLGDRLAASGMRLYVR